MTSACTAPPTKDRKNVDPVWADALRRIHAESAGLVKIEIVRPSDRACIAVAAALGDVHSARVYHLVTSATRQIAAAPKHRPLICASCPRPIRPRGEFTFAIAIPVRDDPTRGLTIAVCSRCAVTVPDVMNKACTAFARLWPGLRQVEIHPDVGHA